MIQKFIDFLVPYWGWFTIAFNVVVMILSVINFGLIIATFLSVKGFTVPYWFIGIVGIFIVGICITIGYIFEKYKVWDRVNSFMNRKTNPELRGICESVIRIEKELQEIKEKIK